MSEVFGFPVTVYYEDTDVAGVVYHANYLKFMERARTEWLRHLGLDQTLLMEQGIAFAVVDARVRYHKPARFNDRLWVTASVIRVGRASLSFAQTVCYRHDNATLLADGEVKVACVTMQDMKARPLPEAILEELSLER
jgi:acyl-CoA thioester hydrolase